MKRLTFLLLLALVAACGSSAPATATGTGSPAATATGVLSGPITATLTNASLMATVESPTAVGYPPFHLSVSASSAAGTFAVQAPQGAAGTATFDVYLASVPSAGIHADTDLTSCAVLSVSTSGTSDPFGSIGPTAGCNAEAARDDASVTGAWTLNIASVAPVSGGDGYLVHGSLDATLLGELGGVSNGQSVNTHVDF